MPSLLLRVHMPRYQRLRLSSGIRVRKVMARFLVQNTASHRIDEIY